MRVYDASATHVTAVSGAGGNGGAGVEFTGAGSLTNTDHIEAGHGGDSGKAQASLLTYQTFNALVADQPSAVVAATSGHGGDGGAGVTVSLGGTLTNLGRIDAGHGGDSGKAEASIDADYATYAVATATSGAGGTGGAAMTAGDNSTLNDFGGDIEAGHGGNSGKAQARIDASDASNSMATATSGAAGNGGAAVVLGENGTLATLDGDIEAGNGGDSGKAEAHIHADVAAGSMAVATSGQGGDGGAALKLGDNTAIETNVVLSNGNIEAGHGGDSGNAEAHIRIADVEIVPTVVLSVDSLTATATSGSAGKGGAAVVFGDNNTLTSYNDIEAGHGGDSGKAKAHIDAGNGDASLANATATTGPGGVGGAAVAMGAHSFLNSYDDIEAGNGGDSGKAKAHIEAGDASASTAIATSGAGGAGGAAVVMGEVGALYNVNTIEAGNGGESGKAKAHIEADTTAANSAATATSGAAGIGGAAVAMGDGGALETWYEIKAGQGGDSGKAEAHIEAADASGATATATSGSAGTGGAAVVMGAGSTLDNYDDIRAGKGGDSGKALALIDAATSESNSTATAISGVGGMGGAAVAMGADSALYSADDIRGGKGGDSGKAEAYVTGEGSDSSLAGSTATATSGTAGNGGAAVTMGSDSTLISYYEIKAGSGGDSGKAEAGVGAATLSGSSAAATSGGAGNGGVAVTMGDHGDLYNDDEIKGGKGGDSGRVEVGAGGDLASDSTATATSGTAGNGGVAVAMGGTGSLQNYDEIKAGKGGDSGKSEAVIGGYAITDLTAIATSGTAGNGGVAVTMGDNGYLYNGSEIKAGKGGDSGKAKANANGLTVIGSTAEATSGAAGNGGVAVALSSGSTLENDDEIQGGRGGDSGKAEAFVGGMTYEASNSLAKATSGAGGNGGGGVTLVGGSLTNNAYIGGGDGGHSAKAEAEVSAEDANGSTSIAASGNGGNGGTGADLTGGIHTLADGSYLEGGDGGKSGKAKAHLDSGDASMGAVTATSGAGGAGGAGMALSGATVSPPDISLFGENVGRTIEGGDGGDSGRADARIYAFVGADTTASAFSGQGGQGGAGIVAAHGSAVTLTGDSIEGGEGGRSGKAKAVISAAEATNSTATATSGDAGQGGAAVMLQGGSTLTKVDSQLVGGDGGDAGKAVAKIDSGAVDNAKATAAGGKGGDGGAGAAVASGSTLTTVSNIEASLLGIFGGHGGNGGDAHAEISSGDINDRTASVTATGGRGGNGGAAIALAAATLINTDLLLGGNAGNGGEATSSLSANQAGNLTAIGGNGGSGGAGVAASASTITNRGAIVGGNGGYAGETEKSFFGVNDTWITTDGTKGTAGAGGVGITGSDLTVVNSAYIAGGLSADETPKQGDAVFFTGGVNSLTLEAGSTIVGNVQAYSLADTLALGGTESSTFSAANIGPDQQYRGFGVYNKVGSSTWTLTDTTTAVTPWTLKAGVLTVAQDGSLGDVSGTLTLAGGTLQTTANITTARAVKLSGLGGAISTDEATKLTLTGLVSGEGGLTKEGTGSLHLTHANTYTGVTLINEGTLIGGTASFGASEIVVNAALEIQEASNTTMLNTISGEGSLTKTGAGLVFYNGDGSRFSGIVSILDGTFSVNGVMGGETTMRSGSILKGNGTIGTTILDSGATLAPGNSVGTLTVAGDFTFNPGSKYEVEVIDGKADKLIVNGIASLGGAQVTVTQDGNWDITVSHTILTSNQLVGTFSTEKIASTFTFLNPSLSYVDNKNVLLSLTRNDVTFKSVALTPNQYAAAGALDTLTQGKLYEKVVQLNKSNAPAAFNQLAGELHASARTALLEDSRFVREAGMDRVRQTQGGASTPDASVHESENGNATWARVFGSQGHIDGDGNASRVNRDVAGFLVGADTSVSGGWRVGGLAGYSKTDLDVENLNSTAKTDSYHVGLYGGNQWDNTSLRLGASYSWNKMDTQRHVSFVGLNEGLKAKYDAATTQLFGEIGQRIDMGTVALEPFAGLAYVNIDADGFSENGGASALHGGGGTTDATFSTLGVRASTQLSETTRVRGTVGWRHAIGDKTPTSTQSFSMGSPFTVSGVPMAKNVAIVEAGLETKLEHDLTLGASYSGQFGNGLKDHGFKLTLGWKF